MKITDKEVLKMLKSVKSIELTEAMETYPEDEVRGQSEKQILADELWYRLNLYEEDGTMTRGDYLWACRVLKETNRGKTMPLDKHSLKPKYKAYEVENAKGIVNEHRRLKSLMKKLNDLGYYG